MILRLVLDVTYNLNGMPQSAMEANLRQMVWDAMSNGTITGETPAEVEDYSYKIAQIQHAGE